MTNSAAHGDRMRNEDDNKASVKETVRSSFQDNDNDNDTQRSPTSVDGGLALQA